MMTMTSAWFFLLLVSVCVERQSVCSDDDEDDDEDDDDAFQTGPPHVRVSCRVPLTLIFHYAFHDSLLATSPRRYSQASTTLTIPLRTTKTIVDGSPTLPSNCVRHQCLQGNMRLIEDRLVQAVST